MFLLVVLLVVASSFSAFASWNDYDGKYSDSAVLFSTPQEYQQETGKTVGDYKQSPQYDSHVSAGTLPPVAERLPKEPAVFQPADSIGTYGGTLVRNWTGPSDHWGLRKLIGERFVAGGPDGKVYPNVAKSWDILDDGATYVFHLREGMKWSDGVPVTADDALFWWEVHTDRNLEGPPNSQWYVDGKVAVWKKIDDYTFSVSFAKPYATFLEYLASEGHGRMVAPLHYLKQFYPKYTPLADVQKVVEEEGFDEWPQLFDTKYNWPNKNPERPVIAAWMPANDPSSTNYMLVRNPYYWKVDTEGHQLPYIDKINNVTVSDNEMIVMNSVSGNIDFQSRRLQFADYPLLMENRDNGNYNVMLLEHPTGGLSIFLNQTLKNDPVKKKLFLNDNFRKALSLAINRHEINEIRSFGQVVERQAAFPEASPFYDKEWADAYAQLDFDQANKMLDEIGLEMGNDGYRQLSDGRRLSIAIQDSNGFQAELLELIRGYFKKVGVDLQIKTPERTLFETLVETGDYEAILWGFDTQDRPDIMGKGWAPNAGDKWASPWGPAYAEWYSTDGESGAEPPADVKRLHDILNELPGTVDWDKRAALMQEVAQIHKEHLHIIGVMGATPGVLVYSNNLKNVVLFTQGILSRDMGLAFIQQMYFAK